jgi:excisionase family DNA binding protein
MNDVTQLVLLPKTEWEAIKNKLEEVASLVVSRNNDEANSLWIESGEARKLLGVSQTTWQNLRDQRKIPFSQFGRKIYVKKADLQSFMESNYITSKNMNL